MSIRFQKRRYLAAIFCEHLRPLFSMVLLLIPLVFSLACGVESRRNLNIVSSAPGANHPFVLGEYQSDFSFLPYPESFELWSTPPTCEDDPSHAACKNHVVVAADVTIAPNGTMTADRLIDTHPDVIAYVYKHVYDLSEGYSGAVHDLEDGAQFAFRVFLKPDITPASAIVLWHKFFGDPSPDPRTVLEIEWTQPPSINVIGVGPGPHDYGLKSHPNGWYEAYVTLLYIESNGSKILTPEIQPVRVGAVGSLYVWGAELLQVE